MDIKAIIEQILSDKKLSNSKNIETKLYKDQPILRPASQMPQYVPEKIKDMRSIALLPESLGKFDAWIFLKQGKFMAEYEDDFIYDGTFVRYYPTYQYMNDKELRGYFSWRTKVRKGTVEKTSLSFAYLYIYEQLNCIAFEAPEDALNSLKEFYFKYREIDKRIEVLTVKWICDFVVFHGLDKSFLNGVYDFSFENALEVLADVKKYDYDRIFSALCTLSSYNITSSKLYKTFPEDAKSVCCKAYILFSEYFEKKRKNSLFTILFGDIVSSSYTMFASAVFSGRNRHSDCKYEFNSVHKYICFRGHWQCEKYYCSKNKNVKLGIFIKAVDRYLRENLNFEPSLSPGKETKIMMSLIARAANEYFAEKKQAERMKVEIDFSKLSSIRLSSDITLNKLITEDDTQYEKDITASETVNRIENGLCKSEISFEKIHTPLNDSERFFLKCLIDNTEYGSYLRKNNIMLSVIIDSINEKMFEIFADTVIICENETPIIIDDYLEELKNYI